MAYRKPYSKPTAKSPRFRIERSMDDKTFLVLDTLDFKYTEFASRQDAERECNTRNGTSRPKTSEPAELPALREKLRREGNLSPEEFATLNRPRERDLKPVRLRPDQQILVNQIRKALPAFCRAWGCMLARQSGIADALRLSMTTEEVVAVVGLENPCIPSTHHAIETLDARLRPIRWGRLEDEGFEGVIVVHYLSSDSARLKARYLGRSERDYFRKLDEGHRWLVRCIAVEYDGGLDFDYGSVEALEAYNADPDNPADNDSEGYWGLNPGDLYGFTVEKW